MTWLNDGLLQRFGLEQAAAAKTGVVRTAGENQQLVVHIKGTDVPTTDAPIHVDAQIPQGSIIITAELFITTAFAGTNATLDVGYMSDDGDGTYTTGDDDGFIAQLATTSMDTLNGADDYQVGSGAAIAVKIAEVTGGRPLVVSYGYNTAAFTAGEADLVITYRRNVA